MIKSKKLLNSHQCQILNHLGIDAWYIKPLSRIDMDVDYKKGQQKIANAIEKLTTPLDNLEKEIDKPQKDASLATSKYKEQNTLVTKKGLMKETIFEPIHLSADINLHPPINNIINFPPIDKNNLINPVVSEIDDAINKLKENNKTDKNIETLFGKGSVNPEWLFVIAPPTQQHIELKQLFNDSEEQLFNEVLQSIEQNWDNIYVTPLLKQSVYKHKDPDNLLLEKHLPILHAEINWLQPKRIFLMGRIPNQAILSTRAPLSKLMLGNYQLQIENHCYPLTILPSLHYFLAIPAEKKLLWHKLKQLS